MAKRSLIRAALVLGVALSAGVGSTACSGGGSGGGSKTVADVKPAAMPAGGEWQGVYYNQLYGFLHITESSGAVQGAWRTAGGDKWGELYGEADGDLLRFSWTEHKIGVVGPAATSSGKGYFKYTIPNAEEAHEIKGEWGLGESDAGHSWDCVKQLNMDPDPKSVRPNELESQVGASGFDGTKGDAAVGQQEKKKAEGDGADGEKSGGEKSDGDDGMGEL
jgi:hypothetical protein